MNDPYARLSLKGRVIIITGGASGIGCATAVLSAARGASVVIADLDADAGRQVTETIRKAGGQAAFIGTDVGNEDDVMAMVAFAVSTFGGLHGAFNNAGIHASQLAVAEQSLAQWQRSLHINLTGVFLCMKHAIAHMARHGGGSIVNTASIAGIVGFESATDYISGKHGVVGLTRAAAADYSAKGIRVNAVLPGSINTPMLRAASSAHPTVQQSVRASAPMGRVGEPEEIAEAVAWLMSDAASYVTGACMAIDGGYTAI